MFEKNVLILIVVMLLLGAAILSAPIPALWGMACLIFLALSIAMRGKQQG